MLLFRSGEACWPNAKEKPSLYSGSWQKYITQDAEFFPDTSLDKKLDREKKTGLWHLQESCNYELNTLSLSDADCNLKTTAILLCGSPVDLTSNSENDDLVCHL
jgi:hypothetical protein